MIWLVGIGTIGIVCCQQDCAIGAFTASLGEYGLARGRWNGASAGTFGFPWPDRPALLDYRRRDLPGGEAHERAVLKEFVQCPFIAAPTQAQNLACPCGVGRERTLKVQHGHEPGDEYAGCCRGAPRSQGDARHGIDGDFVFHRRHRDPQRLASGCPQFLNSLCLRGWREPSTSITVSSSETSSRWAARSFPRWPRARNPGPSLF